MNIQFFSLSLLNGQHMRHERPASTSPLRMIILQQKRDASDDVRNKKKISENEEITHSNHSFLTFSETVIIILNNA